MRAVFDLDDTISVHNNRDYANATPIMPVVKKTGVSRQTAYSRIRRGWKPERAVTEKASPKRVLSEREVKNIRKQYKPRDKRYGAKAMARKYGVSVAAIEAIVENRNWKGVE